MKKKFTLLFALLLSVTGAFAESADGILSVNVMNAIEGYTGGRMDIVLNNTNTQEWASFQFDIKAPAGVTITGGEEGELFNGHTLNGEETDATNHIWRFTAARTSGGSANFKSTTGTLMTVKFTVANPYTTENGQIELSTISVGTINAVNYDVANFNTPFAIDNTAFTVDENAKGDFIVPPTGTYNVTVKRILKAGVWNTIMLPFTIQYANINTVFGANTKVAKFSSVTPVMTYDDYEEEDVLTGLKMNFETLPSTENMKFGKPFLIKVTDDITQFTIENVSSTSIKTGSDNKTGDANAYMEGSYKCINVASGNLYISNNLFKYSGGNATIKGLRAYFYTYNKLPNYQQDTSAGARILLNIDGESTTGIFNLEEGTLEEGKYYNLKGQRVANPTKGLYIVDGKKVIIK